MTIALEQEVGALRELIEAAYDVLCDYDVPQLERLAVAIARWEGLGATEFNDLNEMGC